jgi:hypothetical protein
VGRAAPVLRPARGRRRRPGRPAGHRLLRRRCFQPRPAAFVALGAGLAAYYLAADSLPGISIWWEVVALAFGLMPAVFLFDWLVLPLSRARGLMVLAVSLGALAVLAQLADMDVLANFAKLTAVTFFAFWFLAFFEELVLLVAVALIIPFVDAYSVFRGPTGNIVEHHSNLFNYLSFYFALPSERNDPRLGIPDLLFFALFLAAARRFGLRAGWTWLAMIAGLGATIAIDVWADVPGLPALPALSAGFILPNVDRIWRQLVRRGRDRP